MTTSSSDTSPSEHIERDAEVQRLGRLLGIAHVELDYLRGLSSQELRALRGQVTASLYDNQKVLAKLAAATKLLPVGLVASLAEKAFGPMLAARIAGMVEPERAIDIASRLPVTFLAEVAKELDPRRAASILAEIPAPMIADVSRYLIAQEEWVAMGSFYGYLPDPGIRAAMGVADPHALLHISLVLDDKSRLAHVLDLAGPDTLSNVSAAAADEGLTDQLKALEMYLTPGQLAQLPGA